MDEEAVTRIGENLIENAVKFTPEGGHVEIRLHKTGNVAVLEVEDTGIGIGEDALPDVFTTFRQESEGLDREYEGTGLRLSIVEQFVKVLGGTIEVVSEKGTGSCFRVRLLLSKEAKENGDPRSQGRGPHRSVLDATASSK